MVLVVFSDCLFIADDGIFLSRVNRAFDLLQLLSKVGPEAICFPLVGSTVYKNLENIFIRRKEYSKLVTAIISLMLDSRSLDIISRFKSAVLTKVHNGENRATVASLNRGKKLLSTKQKIHSFESKIVEYDGSNRLILTNDVIDRSNYRNKRRWLHYYGTDNGGNLSSDASSDSDEELDVPNYESEFDGNPLKRMRLSEILSPLGHPSEIATHPAISRTYKLTCLPRIASDLIELIEVEQNTLNHLNKLLRVLNGEDWFNILEENLGLPKYDHGLDEQEKKTQVASANGDARFDGSPLVEHKEEISLAQSENLVEDPFFALPKSLMTYEAQQRLQLEEMGNETVESLETVLQDLINYLQLSIQRQQEYIKNLTCIRNGVIKADRYRGDLHRWGKEMGERKN